MPGMKRAFESEQPSLPTKRVKVHHDLRHVQTHTDDITERPQDRAFYDAQLNRSIGVALKAVGFDSAKQSALEMFRAEAEEYMLHFLTLVRGSMASSRRSQPIPQDFMFTLAKLGITESALEDQLKHGIPPEIALPPLPKPPAEEPPPPDLEGMLGPELSGAADKAARSYIPKHFPSFPAKNTWQATSSFTKRDTDPRLIREKATAEGVAAEKALRELMAKAKQHRTQTEIMEERRTQANIKEEKRMTTSVMPHLKRRELLRQETEDLWDDAIGEFQREDETAKRRHQGLDADEDQTMDAQPSQDLGSVKKRAKQEGPLLVNYDRKYWRKSAQNVI